VERSSEEIEYFFKDICE